MKYSSILSWIQSEPWAVHPDKMNAVIGLLEAKSNGVDAHIAETWAALEERRNSHLGNQQGVAILGLHGTMTKRVGLLTGSGGASTDEFVERYKAAMQDDSVAAVVTDIDSHGGSVEGLIEGSDAIFNLRGTKPSIGVINCNCHSAAYFVGSAFDELVITPSGDTGSIGTFMVHVDESQMNEDIGIKVTYIHAGKYKVEGNPDEPLGDEAKAEFQRSADSHYRDFVEHVARNRGTTVEDVIENYGQGRTFRAQEALDRGMVDRIATLDEVIQEQLVSLNRKRNIANRRNSLASY